MDDPEDAGDVPYDLLGGPLDGETIYAPHNVQWYITYCGYRHAVYVTRANAPFELHHAGSTATREEAEQRALAAT